MQKNGVCSEFSSEFNNQKIHGNHIKESSWLFDFSRLPWVVFLSILKFLKKNELCRFSVVNKLWHKACRDPSLWRYLDLVEYCPNISDQDLVRLSSFSNNVVTLRISQNLQCHVLTDVGVSCALKQCSSLVECSISNCYNLSDDVLATLGIYCPLLRKLDVTLSLGLSNDGIRKVCEGCPMLEELILDQCQHLTNETLVHLGKNSTMLKHISATGITHITDEGVLALLQGCQQLETLRFPFCGLSSQSIGHFVSHCTKVVHLDLRGVGLEENDIHNMVASLTKLETLNLGVCNNMTDVSALEIGMYCKKLKHLFLVGSKVTDKGLLQLSAYCCNLLHLDVSWSPGVTEVGARFILNGCPKLKHLGLFRCDGVPESAVNELISEFPHVFISTLKTEMKKSLSRNDEDVT